jgi:alpha-beta hydrolase superfamily lysophospholipase
MDVEVGYGLVEESKKFPVSELTERFKTPLIIFHGMRDEVIPYAASVEFAANCATTNVELHLLKEGDHRLNHAKSEIVREACDFFERSLTSHSDPVASA